MSSRASEGGAALGAAEIQMSMQELINVLQDMLPDIEISKASLANPTSHWVQEVYYKILLEFGFSDKFLEGFFSTAGGRLAIEDYPEIIVPEALMLANLLAACRCFLRAINHDDGFGLLDLIEPDPKRTRRFLMWITNFWLFSNNMCEKLNVVRDEVIGKEIESKRIRADIENLEKKISNVKLGQAEDAMNAKRLAAKNDELQAEIEGLKAIVENEVDNELEQFKASIKTYRDKDTALDATGNELTQEVEKLKKILHQTEENDKTEKRLKDLRTEVDQALSTAKEMEKKVKEKNEQVQQVQGLNEVMGQLEETHKGAKARIAEKKTLEGQTDLLRKKLENLESQEIQLKKHLTEIVQQKASLEGKWKKRKELKEEELRTLAMEVESERKGLKQGEILARDCRTRISNARKELEQLDKRYEDQNVAWENLYANLLADTKEKYEAINAARNEIEGALDQL